MSAVHHSVPSADGMPSVLKAEYNDGVSTLHWGYTTGVWDGTNDPVRVDIVLDHAENY
jgi:hypothetical protein